MGLSHPPDPRPTARGPSPTPGGPPPGIKLVAWLWIVAGLLAVSGSLSGLMMAGSLRGLLPALPKGAPRELGVALALIDHYDLLAFVQLVVAVLSIAAGVGFLALRAWARTTIEALSWLSLGEVAALGILWFVAWGSLTDRPPMEEGGIDLRAFHMAGLVAGTMLVLALAVPLLLLIRYLRGPAVRDAIARAGSSRPRPGRNARSSFRRRRRRRTAGSFRPPSRDAGRAPWPSRR